MRVALTELIFEDLDLWEDSEVDDQNEVDTRGITFENLQIGICTQDLSMHMA